MKRIIVFTLCSVVALAMSAQRIYQKLGRGVVAVSNGSNVTVTWRRLAQEAENVQYNVYKSTSANGSYTKLNSKPLSVSCFTSSTSNIPTGSYLAVTTVTNGVESEKSAPFHLKSQFMRNVFVDIRYKGGPLNNAEYATKYIWPCDLDGDGEMDYVVDRNPIAGGNQMVEAYLSDGTYLWTVDMGPNEWMSNGQDDQVAAFDIDCDGRGEVMLQTSDGTRFWDKAKGTWGLYVNGNTTGDTDKDGIVNYENQGSKNPPRYATVVDGMTGAEKASVEMRYNTYYNRTNKSSLMGDEYNKHVGKFIICYLDGIHPALVMEWHTRSTNGSHHYYSEGFQYDFSSGKAGAWKNIFQEGCGSGSFHSIRVGDVDLDGKDEMIEGGWTMDHTGKVLFNAGISHGDRFRTSDINPELPGIETFAIQQNAGDMLGQILYSAADGKAIKKWYMSGVGDVGRGDCYDMTPDRLGWEMFSTMGGVYDANGDLIPGLDSYFPTEALWWDGDLGREYLAAPDGNGNNAYIAKYGSGRLIEMAKQSGYQVLSEYGARAAFWGDIIGDWREEVLLKHLTNGVVDGFTGFSTDYSTSINNIYCLLEDPAYRGQITSKGYYQTPNPFFYLGWDMPRPQLPPVMVTDLVGKASGTYTDFERVNSATYQDGKSILYDLNTEDEISVSSTMSPSVIYMMPVKGQTTTFSGSGQFGGEGNIWKSQNGTSVINIPITTKGNVIVSEGTLEINSEVNCPLDLRAKGTIAGNGTFNDTIKFEGALNYEGCRVIPNGTMTFNRSLNITKRVYFEFHKPEDIIHINGDLKVSGNPIFTIALSDLSAGTYKLMEFTGDFVGSADKIEIRGITGLSYNVVVEDKTVCLRINEQRQPSDFVFWTGSANGLWDYTSTNFRIETASTEFVAGDKIEFGDEAEKTTITVDDLMPTTGVTFTNDTKNYTINGDGGFSGTGGLTMNGNGRLTINTSKSDYKGATIINSGTVSVKDLADGGMASSIGAASSSASNWKIGKATLIVNNSSVSTNRGLTLTDTATINVPSGTMALKGQVVGKGTFVKTGGGQVNFTYGGTNTYTGGTILNAGTIAMGTWNTTIGSATSKITANGGTITIFNNNTTSAVPSFQNTLEVPKGKTVTMNGGQRCAIKGSLTGEGTFRINFPYVRGDVSTNVSKFYGTYEVTSGQLRLVAAMDFSHATLKLDADNYVAHVKAGSGNEQQLTTKIGALSAANANASFGSGTWNVGYLGTDFSFAGKFGSSSTVNKYGEGKMTLTGASSSPINVYAGTLDAENTSAPITSGTITVNRGGTLTGAGQTGAVVIASGGTLAAGKSSVLTGVLTINGTLKVSTGGVVVVRGRGTTSTKTDQYAVSGRVTLTSPLFQMSRLSGEWTEGDELEIFTGAGTIALSGTPTFEPAVPMAGYKWDWSELESSGIVRVVADPDAIQGITMDEASQQVVFDLMGRRVSNPSKGIYIMNGKKIYIK